MYTMRPALKSGRDVWDRINLPESEFQQRLQRIRKEMVKEDIDVLLLYGRAPDHCGDLCYVSNFTVKLARFDAIIVVPQKDEVLLFCGGGGREFPEVRLGTWIEQLRGGNITEECVKYLNEANLIPSTIGLVGLRQLMPYNKSQFVLESISQCKLIDCDHIMKNLRSTKSEREIDQIRRSARIVNLTFDHIANNPLPNMDERSVEAIINKVARLEGAADCRVLIAKPQEKKWALRPAQDIAIAPKETIIVYLAVEFERYWSEGIKTFIVHNDSLMQPGLDNVQSVYDRIVQGMSIDKPLTQFYKEIISELQQRKLDCFMEYGLGNGIGLELKELPSISQNDTGHLKEGMCLTLRLAVNEKDMGAAMIGNTIYLSSMGPELMIK